MKKRSHKREGKHKADSKTQSKRKPKKYVSNTTVLILCVAVPLLLGGFANYYAHKWWILYLPLTGGLLLLGYLGHLAIRSYVSPSEKAESVDAKLQFSVAIETAMVAEAKKIQTVVWFGYGKDGAPTLINPVTDMLYLRLTNGIGAAPIMIDYFSIDARSAGGKWKPASQINVNEGRLFWAATDQGLKSATEVTLDKPQLAEAVIDKNIGSGETIKGWAILERPDDYDAEWRINITTITGKTGTAAIAPKTPNPGGDTFGRVGLIMGANYDLQNAYIRLYSEQYPTR